MSEVLDWQRGEPHTILARAAELLTQGQVVVLPTASAYVAVANGALPAALAELPRPTPGRADDAWMVLVAGLPDAHAWVPALPALAERFARRCWPGPLALVVDVDVPHPQLAGVVCGGTLHLYAPAHEAVLALLQTAAFPVVAAVVQVEGRPAVTAQEAAQAVGDAAALVVDAGATEFGQAPTRVHVRGGQWSVVADGVLSEAVLRQVAPLVIVFVCTGNTCRSPLAEVLCKRLLAERMGCAASELPQRGVVVLSAGLAAARGDAATHEAVEVAREFGGDLREHRSQPLTMDLLVSADHVLVMTASHLRALEPHAGAGVTPRLLAAEGVADPIGQAPEVYRACAKQIQDALQGWLADWQQPDLMPGRRWAEP